MSAFRADISILRKIFRQNHFMTAFTFCIQSVRDIRRFMSITGVLIAALIVGGTGVFIGVFLGIAGKKFAVEVDEKEEAILAELPGNNCGGCGYAGCSGLAAAIAKGEAPVGQCPVGGAPVAAKIAAIMGEEAGESVHEVAFVKCAGT